MLFGMLTAISIMLICIMFHSRNVMLGFPSAIFWAILGGYCYQQSVATWDIYYLMFFASFGMVIFCIFAMYGLRDKDLSGPDADEGKFFDEEKEPDLRGGFEQEPEPSARIRRLHDRANRSRSK